MEFVYHAYKESFFLDPTIAMFRLQDSMNLKFIPAIRLVDMRSWYQIYEGINIMTYMAVTWSVLIQRL